jgi:hypothetical protein
MLPLPRLPAGSVGSAFKQTLKKGHTDLNSGGLL